jgi:FtsP/CotA-like multicopper oxidase with cupredoxin domain
MPSAPQFPTRMNSMVFSALQRRRGLHVAAVWLGALVLWGLCGGIAFAADRLADVAASPWMEPPICCTQGVTSGPCQQSQANEWCKPSTSGMDVALTVQLAPHKIGDDYVRLRSYNGLLTGPTLRFKAGDRINLTLKNALKEVAKGKVCYGVGSDQYDEWDFNTFNFHTHGLLISPDHPYDDAGNPIERLWSDNVLLEILPTNETGEIAHAHGPQWVTVPLEAQYQFNILPTGLPKKYKDLTPPPTHEPGTFWYHPHKHGSTAVQLTSGMAGALIIEGEVDELDGIKDAQERLFVFQQFAYRPLDNSSYSAPTPQPGYSNRDFLCSAEVEVDTNAACTEAKPCEVTDIRQTNHADFTAVNGQRKPGFTMQPGAVERWRFIHGGITEGLTLVLQKCSDSTMTLKLNEIAVDGITLGKMRAKDVVRLYPGQRSDVMVQVPANASPGDTYCLVDQGETDPAQQLFPKQPAEQRQILAEVQVQGNRVTMTLPTDGDLQKIAKPPLKCTDSIPGDPQFVWFAQQVDEGCSQQTYSFFNVNCKRFDPDTPLKLPLGKTQQWVTRSGADNHPFHIHVNPLTVCKGDADAERYGPYWRDTILVRGRSQTRIGDRVYHDITMRTHYQYFPGQFVLHCHILFHEDTGMMQLLQVVDSP